VERDHLVSCTRLKALAIRLATYNKTRPEVRDER
jgi:hypothetical protein